MYGMNEVSLPPLNTVALELLVIMYLNHFITLVVTPKCFISRTLTKLELETPLQ